MQTGKKHSLQEIMTIAIRLGKTVFQNSKQFLESESGVAHHIPNYQVGIYACYIRDVGGFVRQLRFRSPNQCSLGECDFPSQDGHHFLRGRHRAAQRLEEVTYVWRVRVMICGSLLQLSEWQHDVWIKRRMYSSEEVSKVNGGKKYRRASG